MIPSSARVFGSAKDPSISLLAFNESGPHGTGTFIDQSLYAHTLTNGGNVTWDSTQKPTGLNSSAKFNGTITSIITAAANAVFALPGDFTIEAYVRPRDWDVPQNFIVADWDDSYIPGFGALYVGHTIAIWNGFWVSLGSGMVGIDAWYHVAYARQTGTLRGFVNGVLGATPYSYAGTPSGAVTLRLGNDGGGGGSYTDGWIASLRIVKGEALYTGTFTPPPLPLSPYL